MDEKEKARAYDEALERARERYEKVPDSVLGLSLVGIFPELRENEDERIRKDIMILVKDWWDRVNKDNISTKEQMIAWLEKQGQTFTKKDVDDAYLKGICDAKQELEKQCEQKPILDFKASNWYVSKVDGKIHDLIYNPTDKVEPKFKVGDTMRTLQEASSGITSGLPVVVSIDNQYYHCNNEIIAIKDQDNYEYPPMNKKHNDWSEEDEERLVNTTISFLNHYADKGYENAVECIDWLKSLKTTNVDNSSITVEGMYNPTKDVSV